MKGNKFNLTEINELIAQSRLVLDNLERADDIYNAYTKRGKIVDKELMKINKQALANMAKLEQMLNAQPVKRTGVKKE